MFFPFFHFVCFSVIDMYLLPFCSLFFGHFFYSSVSSLEVWFSLVLLWFPSLYYLYIFYWFLVNMKFMGVISSLFLS